MPASGRQLVVRISKTLAFWLRHNPGAGGLTLDEEGWADVPAVLAALSRALHRPVSLAELETVVRENDKQRFSLEAGRIRANQGHSLALDLNFDPTSPPASLFHGTTRERWEAIRTTGGLAKMRRHHVHLSPDVATARRVATRHRGEKPEVLQVDAAAMVADGYAFYRSTNGVYLTESVPLRYLSEVGLGEGG
jgi:putative RNA 2'-phosphotransferase